MRKDLKKRLEKALITLQEPGGSTVRSIIKVINKDSPVLSLRKVLEALQEGINEGFLCMYNGRFKLRQQTCPTDSSQYNDFFDCEDGFVEEKDVEEIARTSESDLLDEESDLESEGEICRSFNLKNASLKNNPSGQFEEPRGKRKSNSRPLRNILPPKKRKTRCFSKCKNRSTKSRYRAKSRARRGDRCSKGPLESGCDSLLEMSPSFSKRETGCKAITEKPDVKKQRGPRCTSMKKDVRMPSKVHIPFAPPTVPQRSNFNDLLRRSPEPVNGPLFDCHKDLSLMPENLGFFGTYC